MKGTTDWQTSRTPFKSTAVQVDWTTETSKTISTGKQAIMI